MGYSPDGALLVDVGHHVAGSGVDGDSDDAAGGGRCVHDGL